MFANLRTLFLLAAILISSGFSAAAIGSELQLAPTEANMMVELPLEAGRAHDDPFNEVSLDVVFTDPNGRELRVPAFWAGGNKWKARYASPVVGTHRFRSECSDDSGYAVCTASPARWKSIRTRATIRSTCTARFAWPPIAAISSMPTARPSSGSATPGGWASVIGCIGPDEFTTLAADRKEKGFNVIQIVAGLYPDMPAFDPRGANEAGFPWEDRLRADPPRVLRCRRQAA